MKFIYSEKFNKQYNAAIEKIRTAFDKQAKLLLADFRHPSIRAKIYNQTTGLWQGRVTRGSWRFYFTINGDAYTLVSIIKHPK
jgi:hypothetical protein